MSVILSGSVLWTFGEEIENSNNLLAEIFAMISGSPPLYNHQGTIIMTDSLLQIKGDLNLTIALNNISELYLGFDDVYKRSFAKNGGLFWQPLRITYNSGKEDKVVYLVIDKTFVGANNGLWFETLKKIY